MVKNPRIPISLTELNRRRTLAAQGIDYREHDRILRERRKGASALRSLQK